MGVGHLAAGLMLKRAEPRANLGVLFFAALLSDFLLGVFYWAGLERAFVPADYARLHYLRFDFPYSHGLAASVLWSAAAFLLAKYLRRTGGTRAGIVIGLAVFSHFVLDFVVHAPELPVLGRDSAKLGVGLWDHMALALTLEVLLAAVGLALYLSGGGGGTRGRLGVVILMVIFSVLTVAGMTASAPPDLNAAGASWIAVPLVLVGIGYWLDGGAAAVSSG